MAQGVYCLLAVDSVECVGREICPGLLHVVCLSLIIAGAAVHAHPLDSAKGCLNLALIPLLVSPLGQFADFFLIPLGAHAGAAARITAGGGVVSSSGLCIIDCISLVSLALLRYDVILHSGRTCSCTLVLALSLGGYPSGSAFGHDFGNLFLSTDFGGHSRGWGKHGVGDFLRRVLRLALELLLGLGFLGALVISISQSLTLPLGGGLGRYFPNVVEDLSNEDDEILESDSVFQTRMRGKIGPAKVVHLHQSNVMHVNIGHAVQVAKFLEGHPDLRLHAELLSWGEGRVVPLGSVGIIGL